MRQPSFRNYLKGVRQSVGGAVENQRFGDGYLHRADVDRAGVRLGVSQGSSSQGVLGQRLKLARLVPVASLDVAQQMLQRGELDAFATNKGILFELSEKVLGSQVLTDRWGLENLAIAIPKGREAGRAYLNDFAQARVREGDVKRMSERAGLRGLANAP